MKEEMTLLMKAIFERDNLKKAYRNDPVFKTAVEVADRSDCSHEEKLLLVLDAMAAKAEKQTDLVMRLTSYAPPPQMSGFAQTGTGGLSRDWLDNAAVGPSNLLLSNNALNP